MGMYKKTAFLYNQFAINNIRLPKNFRNQIYFKKSRLFERSEFGF
jgi:hypothetical protein